MWGIFLLRTEKLWIWIWIPMGSRLGHWIRIRPGPIPVMKKIHFLKQCKIWPWIQIKQKVRIWIEIQIQNTDFLFKESFIKMNMMKSYVVLINFRFRSKPSFSFFDDLKQEKDLHPSYRRSLQHVRKGIRLFKTIFFWSSIICFLGSWLLTGWIKSRSIK